MSHPHISPHFMSPGPNSTYGAVFTGNIFGAFLYGITTLQAFIYFRGNPQDRRSFRLLIAFLWILDSLQVAFMTQGVYQYLVFNRTDTNVPWTILSQVIATCLSDSIVRCIFARRIWFLSGRKKVLLFIILSITFLVFATGMAFAIRGFIEVSYAKLVVESSWLLYTSLGGAVFADMLVAISLCVLLDHSRSGFKSSDSLVNTLMWYSINTGILTSVCAVSCFVTFTIWPHSFIFIGIYFVLGKLYVNTILAVLNTREFLRARNPGVTTIPQSPSAIEPLSFLPTLSNPNGSTIERPQPLKLAFQCKTTQQHSGT